MPDDQGDGGEVISLQQRREEAAAKAKQDRAPVQEVVTFILDDTALVVVDEIIEVVGAENRGQAVSLALIWCKWILDQKKQGYRFFIKKDDENQLEEIEFPG